MPYREFSVQYNKIPGVLSGEGVSAGEKRARWSAACGSGEWCVAPPVPVPHGIVPEQYFGMFKNRMQ